MGKYLKIKRNTQGACLSKVFPLAFLFLFDFVWQIYSWKQASFIQIQEGDNFKIQHNFLLPLSQLVFQPIFYKIYNELISVTFYNSYFDLYVMPVSWKDELLAY